MHSEQIEAQQQRGTLTGTEGHAEHPHQTRTTSPNLREQKHKVKGDTQLISLYYYSYQDDKLGSTRH